MRTVEKDSPYSILLDALVTGGDGSVERQEARGQQSFVKSDTLPKEMLGCNRSQLEKMGIVFGDNADDLFVFCTLPEGWTKQRTDHSMWSSLLDEKGRKRASIFYKAAFYDRSAHIGLERRYNVEVCPVAGWSGNYKQSEWHCVVKDGDTVLWQSECIDAEPEYGGRTDDGKRQAWLEWVKQKDNLGHAGAEWLATNYPDWQDPTAHW
jgi:hypothetical protein